MADVLEVLRFIAAQRRLGEVRLLRKLFQQMCIRDRCIWYAQISGYHFRTENLKKWHFLPTEVPEEPQKTADFHALGIVVE